jgi:capsular polysaccharide biosynthesis protein
MKKRNEEFNIKDLVHLFRPFLWVICIFSLLVSLVLGGYSAFVKGDTYTSSAKLHIIKQNSSQINVGDIDLISKVIEDYEVLIGTDMFLNYVIKDVVSDPSYKKEWAISKEYVKAHIRTKAVTDDILEISVSTDDAIKSNLIATAASEVIRDHSIDLFAFGSSLSVKIVHSSTPAGSANNKHVVRNALIGFFGGMIFSMIVIFIISSFDIVIRDKKKLEDTFSIPVLGLIPKYEVEGENAK